MKTTFWSVCTLAVIALFGGVYFSTAQMTDAPVVLSDSQMEQLSGTRTDWTCQHFPACPNITCTSANLVMQHGFTGCYSCETQPNDTCSYSTYTCKTCLWAQYHAQCGGKIVISGLETWHKCDLN